MCKPTTTVNSNTGFSSKKNKMIPSVGFGTFNSFKDNDKVYEAVKYAIKHGYRLIDCASLYGNEKEVGRAINESISEGVVTREELWICSKLWNTEHDPKDVEPACRRSLEAMGLDYFDIYMMHWPVHMSKQSKLVSDRDGGEFEIEIIHSGDRDRLAETYQAMEDLVEQGLVANLGVSNFSSRQLAELLQDCSIPPIANEIERHPLLQQPRLFDYCQEHGIRVIGYSPLGKIGYREDGSPDMLAQPTIQRIARETGKSPSQVVLAWAVQSGSCVIPKSLTPTRIESNFDIQNRFLTIEQMNDLYDLDQGHRYVRVPYYDFPDDAIDLSLTQPKATKGVVDEDNVYRNRFERPGKPLGSNIIIESGAIRKLKDRAREYVPEHCHEAKNYVIVDEIVDELYGDVVVQGFNDAGLETYKIVIPADAVDESGNPSAERHKTLGNFSKCADQILENGISKNSCIISLGGGVVNNLCGFLASSLYRGIALIHITTSMMGMTDAAIDFKQAVNHHLGKNLLGSYYPATNIVIDPEVLETLSKRHILNGISEALKHALAQSRDMTEAIVNPLRDDLHKALRDPAYLEMVCRECIDHKVPTLTNYKDSDFNEMVPQYGHALAHAIEHLSFHTPGVSPLLHGEAVAIGMAMTAEVALILGVCDQATVDDHYKYISQAGLPVFVPKNLSIDAIQYKLTYDKHYVKKPQMGLLQEIGHMHCQDNGSYAVEVENDVIKAALLAHMKRRDSCTTPSKDLYTLDACKAVGFRKHNRTNSPSSVADANGEWDPATASSFGEICNC
ncbi:aldo-keto oxidoreductase [Nitzschia inconspicua]|uniref:Aldo-keto oxidoreductase n=1 Tax=Nitzschia inconspicua TaxID=303405 RepID=A0A9K3Q7K5_9STRA|nr:aldo-keto oxidoreductase [Nitzschia inconspicua]